MTTETADVTTYVTIEIAGQLFGLPIGRVREVFAPGRITRVPHAGSEIAGVLNLRGRIVTAIDMRRRLGGEGYGEGGHPLAVGIDHDGDSFALIVDRAGDVLDLPNSGLEPTPATLDPVWARVVDGVHRIDRRLMLVLDVDRALGAAPDSIAA